MTDKPYKIRPLVGKDLFKISKFIEKLGVNRLEKIFSNVELMQCLNDVIDSQEKQNIAKVGQVLTALASLIIECLCGIEEELNELLESVSNLSKEEISELPLKEYVDMVKNLFMQKDFLDFFGHIWGQFTRAQTATRTA